MKRFLLSGSIALMTLSMPRAQDIPKVPDFLGESEPRSKLLFLGTFHFKDAGLDDYKPTDIDIMSPKRQEEIMDLVESLAEFQPTKIAIEWRPEHQERTDSLYREYLAGRFELRANEVYQLGFRLAKQLGHEELYCVDTRGRSYEEIADPVEVALANDQGYLKPIVDEWDRRYKQLYDYGDSVKHVWPVRDYLLYLNSPERLRIGHGHYVHRALAVGNTGQYPVVDQKMNWYNRNLRIFANLLRLIESPGERILLIIGAGHIPIIKHTAESCPDVEVVEVAEVLR